ncbi:LuxR C-terminal-related transcriptional regulator [Actinomycetospora sp. TBRC 11914]|uniref:LuxR C-terminal-related transcriptional regulator n=1 Tax=Actinomycetospora sp. TBRC 11914 TaxID=2729387 RepID=UPI0037C02498
MSGRGVTRGSVPAVPAARSPHPERPAGALFTPAHGLDTSGEPISVLLVDADAARREVVAHSLVGAGAGHVMEAASSEEARARALSGPPCELAVVDLDLPDGGALALIGELRGQGWRTVVSGGPDDPGAARAAFEAGALAYLLTSSSTGIGGAARRFLEPGPAAGGRPSGGARVPGVDDTPCELSTREVQVLQSVADGQSNHEIGEELGLSALTVKSHLSRIGRKLGTGDRARMVVLAMRAGVVR